jgi:hypothetical protein
LLTRQSQEPERLFSSPYRLLQLPPLQWLWPQLRLPPRPPWLRVPASLEAAVVEVAVAAQAASDT